MRSTPLLPKLLSAQVIRQDMSGACSSQALSLVSSLVGIGSCGLAQWWNTGGGD